jgi:hypothetical protein
MVRWASLAAAVLLVAVGSFWFQRQRVGADRSGMTVAVLNSDGTVGLRPPSGMDATSPAEPPSAPMAAAVPIRAAESKAAATPDSEESAVASSDAASGVATSLASGEAAVDPFLRTSDWDVVVLEVSSSDRSVAMKQIEAFMQKHGFNMNEHRDEVKTGSPDWLGVVLTSAPAVPQQMTDDAVSQGIVDDVEWDPRTIAETSREDLIDAVRRSLQTPTESELIHGRVYVAVPRINSEADHRTDDLAGTASEVLADPTGGGLTKPEGAPAGSGRMVRSPSLQSSRPVLLVFRFREPDSPDAVSSDGRI